MKKLLEEISDDDVYDELLDDLETQSKSNSIGTST